MHEAGYRNHGRARSLRGNSVDRSGEHAVKTTVEFCESHDLGFTYCANILRGVCRRPGISCTELARQPIQDQHGNLQTTVVIYEGQNPSKTILKFWRGVRVGTE